MHRPSYMLLAAIAVVVAFSAPSAADAAGESPAQVCCSSGSTRPALISHIRATLPHLGDYNRWAVFCTPDDPDEMTCWARNPAARFVRRYHAAVFAGGYDLQATPPWSIRILVPPVPGNRKMP